MPQNRISICTSFSVGSRRSIVEEANGDVALETEYALALYMVTSPFLVCLSTQANSDLAAGPDKALKNAPSAHGVSNADSMASPCSGSVNIVGASSRSIQIALAIM